MVLHCGPKTGKVLSSFQRANNRNLSFLASYNTFIFFVFNHVFSCYKEKCLCAVTYFQALVTFS